VSHHATYPIGPFQAKVLATIQETPGLSLKALARHFECAAGQVGNAVRGLEKRGLVTTQLGRTPSGQTGRLCYAVAL
jgi:DNA-binding MarR family transcriptional regulator